MKVLNNELFVTRGEYFIFDRIIVMKNGDPYIINNKLLNPYILFTITNERYKQDRKYLYNRWLDLSSYPKFNITEPLDLLSIKTDASGEESKYNSFDEITELQNIEIKGVTYENVLAYGYVNDSLVIYYADDAVFYTTDKDGNKTYKYWNTSASTWNDYSLRITLSFIPDVTQDFVEQSYLYSISLVSGGKMIDYLRKLCDDNSIQYNETDNEKTLYDLLVGSGIVFPENFNYNRVLEYFDIVKIILPATKMTVSSNLQGGKLW